MNIHFNTIFKPRHILILITGILIMTTQSCTTPEIGIGMETGKTDIYSSPQYNDGKFAGPVKALTMGGKEMLESVIRYFKKDNGQEPKIQLPVMPTDLTGLKAEEKTALNSTWLGHSSLMINISGYRILTDPVFETKVSIVGPSRYNGEAPLDPESLPNIDVVVISHDHYDHLNKASIKSLDPKTKLFITPLAVGARLKKWGVSDNKIIELDWWDSFRFDNDLTITATPSQHFSGRGLFDRNKTLWASWVFKTDAYNVFFSGDSGYFDGFKKIGEKHGPFDMTFMECGAYDKLWRGVHMFPEETVQAHLDLKGKILHPIHWGTFNLAHHAWYDPMQRVKKAADDYNITLATPIIGQTIDYPSNKFGMAWWRQFTESQPALAFAQPLN